MPTKIKFEPTWESLLQYTTPDWYIDAKFGIFIHWGVYSVPAHNCEWYPQGMYHSGNTIYEHHRKTWGPQDKFGYKDFIPLFKAEKFDPTHWAELFKKAGARYVVPVAEHHDGFAMYDCSLCRWNSVNMGPKRDVIAELSSATRNAGMQFGVSSHRAEHWWFFNGGRKSPSDVLDPAYADLYGPAMPGPLPGQDGWTSKDWEPRPDAKFLEDWLARTCEIVDKYNPSIVYFDWWIEQIVFKPYLQRFASYYYNRALEWNSYNGIINAKYGSYPDGSAVFDIERGRLKGTQKNYWQCDTSMYKTSWCDIENQQCKTSEALIHELIDIVSKNGGLLLNVGPRADGTITEQDEKTLTDIGDWLRVNGEAIYGTRSWKVFGEGPTDFEEGAFKDNEPVPYTSQDIRFTTKQDTLYALLLKWPEDKKVTIKSLGTTSGLHDKKISRIDLIGSSAPVQWTLSNNGVEVILPQAKPCNAAYVLRVR